MAIVFRSTNGKGSASPFWYMAFNYRLMDGRLVRVKKSTGCSDKRVAQRWANRLEVEMVSLAAGRVTIEKLRETLLESFDPEAGPLAAKMMKQAVADLVQCITGETLDDYTAADWLREWLKQKSATAKIKSMVRYRTVIERFLTALGHKARAGLQHIRPVDLRKFRDAQMDAGKAPKSCNMELKIVAMPFRKAHKLGIIRINPAEAVENLEAESERREPFTIDQVRAILAHAPDNDWRGMIRFGFYTGARLSDCARMKWGNVDLHARTLTFTPAKTATKTKGRKVVQPMHEELHAWLMSQPAPDDDDAFLFPSLANVGSSGHTGLSRRFLRIMEAAGVTAPLAREKGKAREGVKSAGRIVRSLSFHSLRHTLTSLMHNAGVSPEIRMQFTGHSTEEAHERYTHTQLETLRGALASVPSL